jgi:hypothetical protein
VDIEFVFYIPSKKCSKCPVSIPHRKFFTLHNPSPCFITYAGIIKGTYYNWNTSFQTHTLQLSLCGPLDGKKILYRRAVNWKKVLYRRAVKWKKILYMRTVNYPLCSPGSDKCRVSIPRTRRHISCSLTLARLARPDHGSAPPDAAPSLQPTRRCRPDPSRFFLVGSS